jgi:hydrogenase nickel incorporation protein HypA/HybF
MHELSLIRALLQQVDELRASHQAHGLRRIDVSIGEFSGVDPDLLQSAFDRSTEGTSLQGVEFAIVRVPLTARCQSCRVDFMMHNFRFVCPSCGGSAIEVIRGEELMLESVTFEETVT